MLTKNIVGAVALLAAGAAACATRTPEALVAARRQYAAAEAGPAAQLAPAELHQAKQALDIANQSFANDPASQRSYDLAYVADRKARWANARGAMAMAERARRQAESDAMSLREQLSEDQRRALSEARSTIEEQQRMRAESQRTLQERERELAETQGELQRLREQSERARRELTELGQLRETERGLVISLSGNVLFESGKAELMGSAVNNLARVADVLRGMENRRVTIEGYTDSVGSEGFNRRLSEDRAEAVRDFFVERGVDASMLRTEGLGEARPVAANDTPEGRAMNRRVEIVIEHERGDMGEPGSRGFDEHEHEHTGDGMPRR